MNVPDTQSILGNYSKAKKRKSNREKEHEIINNILNIIYSDNNSNNKIIYDQKDIAKIKNIIFILKSYFIYLNSKKILGKINLEPLTNSTKNYIIKNYFLLIYYSTKQDRQASGSKIKKYIIAKIIDLYKQNVFNIDDIILFIKFYILLGKKNKKILRLGFMFFNKILEFTKDNKICNEIIEKIILFLREKLIDKKIQKYTLTFTTDIIDILMFDNVLLDNNTQKMINELIVNMSLFQYNENLFYEICSSATNVFNNLDILSNSLNSKICILLSLFKKEQEIFLSDPFKFYNGFIFNKKQIEGIELKTFINNEDSNEEDEEDGNNSNDDDEKNYSRRSIYKKSKSAGNKNSNKSSKKNSKQNLASKSSSNIVCANEDIQIEREDNINEQYSIIFSFLCLDNDTDKRISLLEICETTEDGIKKIKGKNCLKVYIEKRTLNIDVNSAKINFSSKKIIEILPNKTYLVCISQNNNNSKLIVNVNNSFYIEENNIYNYPSFPSYFSIILGKESTCTSEDNESYFYGMMGSLIFFEEFLNKEIIEKIYTLKGNYDYIIYAYQNYLDNTYYQEAYNITTKYELYKKIRGMITVYPIKTYNINKNIFKEDFTQISNSLKDENKLITIGSHIHPFKCNLSIYEFIKYEGFKFLQLNCEYYLQILDNANKNVDKINNEFYNQIINYLNNLLKIFEMIIANVNISYIQNRSNEINLMYSFIDVDKQMTTHSNDIILFFSLITNLITKLTNIYKQTPTSTINYILNLISILCLNDENYLYIALRNKLIYFLLIQKFYFNNEENFYNNIYNKILNCLQVSSCGIITQSFLDLIIQNLNEKTYQNEHFLNMIDAIIKESIMKNHFEIILALLRKILILTNQYIHYNEDYNDKNENENENNANNINNKEVDNINANNEIININNININSNSNSFQFNKNTKINLDLVNNLVYYLYKNLLFLKNELCENCLNYKTNKDLFSDFIFNELNILNDIYIEVNNSGKNNEIINKIERIKSFVIQFLQFINYDSHLYNKIIENSSFEKESFLSFLFLNYKLIDDIDIFAEIIKKDENSISKDIKELKIKKRNLDLLVQCLVKIINNVSILNIKLKQDLRKYFSLFIYRLLDELKYEKNDELFNIFHNKKILYKYYINIHIDNELQTELLNISHKIIYYISKPFIFKLLYSLFMQVRAPSMLIDNDNDNEGLDDNTMMNSNSNTNHNEDIFQISLFLYQNIVTKLNIFETQKVDILKLNWNKDEIIKFRNETINQINAIIFFYKLISYVSNKNNNDFDNIKIKNLIQIFSLNNVIINSNELLYSRLRFYVGSDMKEPIYKYLLEIIVEIYIEFYLTTHSMKYLNLLENLILIQPEYEDSYLSQIEEGIINDEKKSGIFSIFKKAQKENYFNLEKVYAYEKIILQLSKTKCNQLSYVIYYFLKFSLYVIKYKDIENQLVNSLNKIRNVLLLEIKELKGKIKKYNFGDNEYKSNYLYKKFKGYFSMDILKNKIVKYKNKCIINSHIKQKKFEVSQLDLELIDEFIRYKISKEKYSNYVDFYKIDYDSSGKIISNRIYSEKQKIFLSLGRKNIKGSFQSENENPSDLTSSSSFSRNIKANSFISVDLEVLSNVSIKHTNKKNIGWNFKKVKSSDTLDNTSNNNEAIIDTNNMNETNINDRKIMVEKSKFGSQMNIIKVMKDQTNNLNNNINKIDKTEINEKYFEKIEINELDHLINKIQKTINKYYDRKNKLNFSNELTNNKLESKNATTRYDGFFNNLFVNKFLFFNTKKIFLFVSFAEFFKDKLFYSSSFEKLKKKYLKKFNYNYIEESGVTYLDYPTKLKNYFNRFNKTRTILKPDLHFFRNPLLKISHSEIYDPKNDQECLNYKDELSSFKNKIIENREEIFKYFKSLNQSIECELITNEGGIYGKIYLCKNYFLFKSDCQNDKRLQKENFSEKIYMALSSIDQDVLSKKEKFLLFRYNDIDEIYIRRFLFSLQGTEIFLKNGRSYFFNLFSIKNNNNFLSCIAQESEKENIKYITNLKEEFNKYDYVNKWAGGKISTFDFICLLNYYSGRTFNDFNQYPVFPWLTVLDTGKKKNENLIKLRDFGYPVSAQDETKRKNLVYYYNNMSLGNFKSHFNTHYSTSATLVYYLVRINPFTYNMIKLQNNQFDHPNRIFHSFYEVLEVLVKYNDNRELIPEIFYFPEIFVNLNFLNLGEKIGYNLRNHNVIFSKFYENNPNVIYPPSNNPVEFMCRYRNFLESLSVSQEIHKWIDNIFGVTQFLNDPYSCNTFQKYAYGDNINLEKKLKTYRQKNLSDQEIWKKLRVKVSCVINFGQCPLRILAQKSPVRNTIKTINKSSLRKNEILSKKIFSKLGNMPIIYFGMEYFQNSKDILFLVLEKSKKKLRIITKKTEHGIKISTKEICIKSPSIGFYNVLQNDYVKLNKVYDLKLLFASFQNGLIFAFTNYLDNSIKFYLPNQTEPICFLTNSFVTSIIKINENQFVTGHQNGMITHWKFSYRIKSCSNNNIDLKKINTKDVIDFELRPIKSLIVQKKEVMSLYYEESLNILIIGNSKGEVTIRNLHSFELLCVIKPKLPNKKVKLLIIDCKINKFNNLLYILAFDIKKAKYVLFGYTINGVKFSMIEDIAGSFHILKNGNIMCYSYSENAFVIVRGEYLNKFKLRILMANSNDKIERFLFNESEAQIIYLRKKELSIFGKDNPENSFFGNNDNELFISVRMLTEKEITKMNKDEDYYGETKISMWDTMEFDNDIKEINDENEEIEIDED